MKKKILIVEDESLIAMDIEVRLQKMGFEVLGIVNKAHKVLPFLEANQPDLVLLDINLSGHEEGIEIAEDIKGIYGIPVVFLTAHGDSHTFKKAMASDPYGFVTKPFKDQDLKHAIEIALAKHDTISDQEKSIDHYKDILSNITIKQDPDNQKALFVKDGSNYTQIKLDEILWIEAYDTYSKIFCKEKQTIVGALLKDLELKLPPKQFQRIHRSYIVALNKISRIEKDQVVIGNSAVPVSRSQKKSLLDNLDIV